MMGGIDKKMFWEEYLAGFKKPAQRELMQVKKFIEEKQLFGLGGFDYQAKYEKEIDVLTPLIRGFSFRAWGDLMAALMNSKTGKLQFTYMDFAWT